MLLRRQKGETASFHTLTSLSAPRTDGQTHISAQTEEGKRGIQSHTTGPPSTRPTLFPNIFSPSTPPPLTLYHFPSFFFLLHLFKSLHFRCIHTFPISLCMSLSPSLLFLTSPCPSLPSLLHLFSLSLSPSFPIFVRPSLSSSLLPYLRPSFPPSIPLL